MTQPYLCSVKDAAHLTGVPVRRINRWVDAGRVKDHTAGTANANIVDLYEIHELEEQRLANGGQLPKWANVT